MPPNVRADQRAPDDDAFAAALAGAGVGNSPAFVTALSGGPDSTALALLAQRFAARHNRRHLALIVDHGLRDGSGDEARRVQARLSDFGVTSRIQSIIAPPPTASIQEWARRHRQDLLAATARAEGAVVLFGHHADDQAETVAMRLRNQSGLAGIGGMPLRRWHHDVLFARPLLGWRRSDLIAVCAAHGCAYETDPSNRNQRFERVRIRQMLAKIDQGGASGRPDVSPAGLVRLASAAGRLVGHLDRATTGLCDSAFTWHPAGYADFDPKPLSGLPQIVWWHVMRRVIMAIGGAAYGPSAAGGRECRARLDHGWAATLGGCHFQPVTHGYRLFRETGRHPEQQQITAGVPMVFAGCWLVTSRCDGIIQPAGIAPADADKSNLPSGWCKLPHRARQAIPVVRTLDGRLVYPHLEDVVYQGSKWPVHARHLGMAKSPVFLTDRQIG